MNGKSSQSGAHGLHVLVVDDDLAVLRETCSRLGSDGHRVSAYSGATGLAALIAELAPDLVLIDVLMPDLSRDALAKLLKSCAVAGTPKIILHSRIAERMLRTVADVRGSSGVIQKTQSELEFMLAFNAILDRLQRTASPDSRSSGQAFSGTHRIRSDAERAEQGSATPLRTGNTRN